MEKIKSFTKENTRWLISFFAFFLFVIIIKNVFTGKIADFDIKIYNEISKYINYKTTTIAIVITTIGSAYIIIPIAFLSLFYKDKKIPKYIWINLICIFVLNQIMKFCIARQRPNINQLVSENGYSFPSGHSMVSLAFYGFIIYLIYKNIENRKVTNIVIVLSSLLILLIGVSRIYLGVHYASDVIGGFAVSLMYLMVFTHIVKEEIINGSNKKIISMD